MSVTGDTTLHFSEEQAMLLDAARMLSRDYGGAQARPWLESDPGYDPALWAQMVALGWPGLSLAESVGGAGLGIGAAVPVFEALGRGLLGTPLLASLLAGELLQRAAANVPVVQSVLRELASGAPASIAWLEGEDWGASDIACELSAEGVLSGSKQQVLDAAAAEWLVVVAQQAGEPVLALLPTDAVPASARREHQLVDLSRRAQRLCLDGLAVPPDRQLRGPAVRSALRDVRLLAALLLAAEATGSAAACLDTTVAYLRTRKQFGKLIGSYQALKHPCVSLLIAIDSSRSLIYHAASLVGPGELGREAEIGCRMAKAQAGDSLLEAGDRAVQFHGAMGFTWECDAQRYLRRALWCQGMYGDTRHHRRRLAALLLGP